MTTHDQHTELTDIDTEQPDTEQPTLDAGPVPDQQTAGGEVLPPAPVETRAETVTKPAAATADSSGVEALFAEGDLSEMRSRWSDVQSAFVDDPRECVQKADGLVSDVVDQLSASFASARSRLEDQWARGEDASTEDLRLALKRYREFFDRLLSV